MVGLIVETLAHTSPAEHSLVVLIGIVAVMAYGWGWVRRPGASIWSLLAWCGGVGLWLLATMPATESWAEESFTGHMVQHLVMIVLVAPLLVVSHPVLTFRQLPFLPDRPSAVERPIARWWRRHGVLAAPLLFLGVLYLTHLTSIYEWALDNQLVHHLEHIAYLGGAVALWATVLSPARRDGPFRVATVLAVIAGSALLGAILSTSSEPLVPTYVETHGGAEAALADQQRAASIMWAGGMALTLPLLLTSVWVWASAEERMARQREAILDARHRRTGEGDDDRDGGNGDATGPGADRGDANRVGFVPVSGTEPTRNGH